MSKEKEMETPAKTNKSAESVYDVSKSHLVNSLRLMGDNQAALNRCNLQDANLRDLDFRRSVAQAKKQWGDFFKSPVLSSEPENNDEDMNILVDSPTTVNHYYPSDKSEISQEDPVAIKEEPKIPQEDPVIKEEPKIPQEDPVAIKEEPVAKKSMSVLGKAITAATIFGLGSGLTGLGMSVMDSPPIPDPVPVVDNDHLHPVPVVDNDHPRYESRIKVECLD